MADKSVRPPAQPRPVRTLVILFILVVAIFGAVAVGTQVAPGNASFTPKLALDLEGGTQLILTPKLDEGAEGGEAEITDEDIDQAIEIIRQRVDASGVAEAEITRQGQANIVVGLPGTPSPETLELVRQSAQLRFRPVLAVVAPTPMDPAAMVAEDPAAPTPAPTDGAPAAPEEIEAAARTAADTDGDGELSTEPVTEPTSNSDTAWMTEQLVYELYTLDCTDPDNLVGGDVRNPADPVVSCGSDGQVKYALGPADVEGTDIASASSGLQTTSTGATTGAWAVNLEFNGEGTRLFRESSQRLVSLPAPQNQLGIVLDGLVISAPTMSVIPDGKAQITGNFDRESAAALANQLNFGSLPLNFEVQSEEQISATLGTEHLRNGLIAGVVGLVLVAAYLLWQYRGLSVIAVASLVLAAILTYGVIVLLSWLQGYRLSLAGVAGLIVAVGITADSFILYFERMRDEIREGRDLVSATREGWARARRTIVISDFVTLLAAVVLYFLAVGGVRGFAFTLGLTTAIDLLVVFFFTHPVMELAIRTRFFGGGHRLSGLNPESLGAVSAPPPPAPRAPRPRRTAEAPSPAGASRMTIAERRAAEREAAARAAEPDRTSDEPVSTSTGEER
ncbi:protein translocase subunit SecD [Georgenia faecalis]|uniref:Protein translocase subunit SecD n=1 Tax=Georgenia faecalis TaxID=2483799 RepID=A0ABV9DCW1_9MICO|nr:protein translocase subunit SecD [Georgenia faecalis]